MMNRPWYEVDWKKFAPWIAGIVTLTAIPLIWIWIFKLDQPACIVQQGNDLVLVRGTSECEQMGGKSLGLKIKD